MSHPHTIGARCALALRACVRSHACRPGRPVPSRQLPHGGLGCISSAPRSGAGGAGGRPVVTRSLLRPIALWRVAPVRSGDPSGGRRSGYPHAAEAAAALLRCCLWAHLSHTPRRARLRSCSLRCRLRICSPVVRTRVQRRPPKFPPGGIGGGEWLATLLRLQLGHSSLPPLGRSPSATCSSSSSGWWHSTPTGRATVAVHRY